MRVRSGLPALPLAGIPSILLAGILACAPAAARQATGTAVESHGPAALASLPLRSRAALDAYLAAHAGRKTPLDLLPPLARRRFIDSLVFGRDSLGGFGTGDLATELTSSEAGSVLALFGAKDMVAVVHSRNPDGPPPWRAAPGNPGPAVLGYDTLYRMQRADRDDPGPLRQRFESMLARSGGEPSDFDAFPERELVYLLRSFELVTFDGPAADTAERLRALVAAMERRGLARAPDLRLVYDRLIGARSFDAARRYVESHPDAGLPAVPRFLDWPDSHASGLSVWRAAAGGTTLQRTALDLGPVQILVTAGCHFSEDAAEDISTDPVLGPVFAAHAHWLMLSPGMEDQDAVRDWNRRFPAAQASQVYDRPEWTLLPPGWTMPTFFIVRDGRVIERITGWPRDPASNRQPLINALSRAGLLQGAASSSR